MLSSLFLLSETKLLRGGEGQNAGNCKNNASVPIRLAGIVGPHATKCNEVVYSTLPC